MKSNKKANQLWKCVSDCETKRLLMSDCETKRLLMSDCDTKRLLMSDCDTKRLLMSDCDTKRFVMSDCDTKGWVMSMCRFKNILRNVALFGNNLRLNDLLLMLYVKVTFSAVFNQLFIKSSEVWSIMRNSTPSSSSLTNIFPFCCQVKTSHNSFVPQNSSTENNVPCSHQQKKGADFRKVLNVDLEYNHAKYVADAERA